MALSPRKSGPRLFWQPVVRDWCEGGGTFSALSGVSCFSISFFAVSVRRGAPSAIASVVTASSRVPVSDEFSSVSSSASFSRRDLARAERSFASFVFFRARASARRAARRSSSARDSSISASRSFRAASASADRSSRYSANRRCSTQYASAASKFSSRHIVVRSSSARGPKHVPSLAPTSASNSVEKDALFFISASPPSFASNASTIRATAAPAEMYAARRYS